MSERQQVESRVGAKSILSVKVALVGGTVGGSE
jgi:hypothetical protein